MKEILRNFLKKIEAKIEASRSKWTGRDEDEVDEYNLNYCINIPGLPPHNSSISLTDDWGDLISVFAKHADEKEYNRTPSIDEFIDTYLTDTSALIVFNKIIDPHQYSSKEECRKYCQEHNCNYWDFLDEIIVPTITYLLQKLNK